MAKTYLQPINLPEGITASIDSDILNIKGKLGDLSLKVPSSVEILQEKRALLIGKIYSSAGLKN